MAEKLRLDLVTPYRHVLSEDVDELTAPGTLGEFGVLPGHTALLATLKIGGLAYRQGSEIAYVAVNWGFVEVDEDRITILVETAEPADEIDLQRAKEALGRAEAALKQLSPEDKDFVRMEAALDRAMIRIQVAGKAGRT